MTNEMIIFFYLLIRIYDVNTWISFYFIFITFILPMDIDLCIYDVNIWISCIRIYTDLYSSSTIIQSTHIRPAPSWSGSSTGGALHLHRRGQGSNPVQAWICHSGHTRSCLSAERWNCGDHSSSLLISTVNTQAQICIEKQLFRIKKVSRR